MEHVAEQGVNNLLQYGALGVIALCFLYGIYVVYRQLISDKKELVDMLNTKIQRHEEFSNTIVTDCTKAMNNTAQAVANSTRAVEKLEQTVGMHFHARAGDR